MRRFFEGAKVSSVRTTLRCNVNEAARYTESAANTQRIQLETNRSRVKHQVSIRLGQAAYVYLRQLT